MRILRGIVAFLVGWYAALLLLISPAFAVPANTVTQPTPPGSPVRTGSGSPRIYVDTFDNGGEILTDGTSPILVLWGQTIQVTCDALAAGERVLVCFSMDIDGVPDVSNGTINATVDGQCHGMILTSVNPTDDMTLEPKRFIQNGNTYPGAQFTSATGACANEGTAYYLASCTVAGEAADCGGASTCDVGCWNSTATEQCTKRSLDMIAGAWVIADTSTASEACTVRVDI